MNNWSPDIYQKAWYFATLVHEGQTYGSPKKDQRIPYINHIGSVATEVIHALPSTPQEDADLAVQCALLHDTIEDTPITYQDIKEQFGKAVADGVQALTKNEDLPTKQAQMEDSLLRIQQEPKAVWMVKMADRITNLAEPPHYWNTAKREAYQKEAQLIYDALAPANEQLAQRLQDKIKAYSNYVNN
ncbi:MAG: bifunctional (p)ppGpp synthetase/guanosine-3',5'-bis(diphosphate) 3'-pyrophosphohydrolase [Aureispira sp.]|nr:bifunctional (p)ppGpp synthetase/guanosine-3',5'-bis(diphosphate) 3'-pyrophosphohydrolase [Aureispira sp.]